MKDEETEEKTRTTYNPHPTTPEEANWYEYLKHAHCHKCPFRIDCDVEDFLSCEVPIFLAQSDPLYSRYVPPDQIFFYCKCWQCFDKDELKEYIRVRQRRLEKVYKKWRDKQEESKKKTELKKKGLTEALPKKKPAEAPAKKTPAQQELFAKKK